jgi:ribosomal protein L3 glutamine methyltransferase
MPQRPGEPVRPHAAYKAAAKELRTLRDVVRFGVSRFTEAGLAFGHGTDNALDEAFYLARHALALPADCAESFLDARLTRTELRSVLQLFQRRVEERVPAAYLTHEAWIGGRRFYVDERAIVPRSFIGHWLQGDLAPWVEAPDGIERVLDLCTGSGCLAVLAAFALPNARVDAVDLSAEALEVARRNVAEHGLEARIDLVQGDLFTRLKRRRYRLILANPPYVRADAMAHLPAEYRHEPALALAGGEDGLDVVRRILAGARDYLARDGRIVVEAGHAREAVEAAFPRTAFTWLDLDGADDAVFVLNRAQLPAASAGG